MAQEELPADSTKGKGKAFFERAEQVSETGNWDFAIEMYLEGIQREPDNVERGHQPLREVSLKAKGGKGPGIIENLKRRAAKDDLTSLINAEYLLAKDPGSVQQMVQLLKAARKLELKTVIPWIANILLHSQRQAKKPNKRILVEVANAFGVVEQFGQAIQACDMAIKIDADDAELREMNRKLSAQFAIHQGGYDEEETHEQIVAWVADGKLDASTWLDGASAFALEDIEAAFQALRERRMVKALIRLTCSGR